MDRFLFAHLPHAERIAALQDEADGIEKHQFRRELTPDEVQERKEELTEKSITLSGLVKEKKEAAEAFKKQMIPLEDRKEELMDAIKNRAEHVTEDCFLMHDHINQEVHYYNQDGERVHTRDMKKGERQLSIKGGLRKVSGDTDNDRPF